GNDVVLVAGGQYEVPCVVVVNGRARIVQHVVILDIEVVRRGGRDHFLDLADVDFLDFRVYDEGARGDAGPKAHDEHRVWIGMYQRGQMPQHALHPHVLQFSGGLHLPADVEGDLAGIG